MIWLSPRRALPWWLLAISVAFNVGFGAAYSARTYGPSPAPAEENATDPDDASSSIALLHESLDLTDEQHAELNALNRDVVEQIHRERAKMLEARGALAELLTVEQPDRQAIDALLDEMSEIQRRSQALVVEHLLLEKQLLGPEQRAVYHDILRRNIFPPGHGAGRRHDRGRGPGAGPRPGHGRGDEGRGRRGEGSGRGRGPAHTPPQPPSGPR